MCDFCNPENKKVKTQWWLGDGGLVLTNDHGVITIQSLDDICHHRAGYAPKHCPKCGKSINYR